jgi:drug/metabolite transporter (DMT)-like permease
LKRDEKLGLLLAAYCAANGAFTPVVAKITTSAASGLAVALFTSAFAGLAAVAMLGSRGILHKLFARKDVATLVTVGAFGTALAFLLYYSGAKRVTAIETALCVQTEPLYSLIGSRLFLGEPLTLRRVSAVAIIALGIGIALGTAPTSGWLGLGLLLATPLAWQTSHWVALRRLGPMNPALLSGARYVFGTGVLACAWFATGGPSALPAPAALAKLLPVVAVQGMVLAFGGTLAWYSAVKRLDLARATAIVVPSGPVLSLVASYLLLGERVTPREAVGFSLTVSGVLLFALARFEPRTYTRPDV